MPRGRIAMHLMKDVLRLHHECGRSQREVARSCGVSVGTVNGLLRKAREAGLGWPLPADLDEQQLHERLYGAVPGSQQRPRRETIDFAAMHKELQRRKHLTVQLLWHAYREEYPDGYSYSQYCELYRAWKASRELVMLQPHKPGEKLFVDYCGASVPVYLATGVRQAVVFVAVLGASSYFYVEASWGQDLEAWVGAHVRTFEDLGGVPEVVVPDNLKSGVTKACRYEPVTNRTYREMAHHFGVAVVPARPYRPKDKAKVEKCVQWVEGALLEALRHERFESLPELNAALQRGRQRLVAKPFQKRPETRLELFEQLDRPALRPLPVEPYEYAEWSLARVNIDYHIVVDGHRYSVPCGLVQQQVDVRRTEGCVEVLHQEERVALHVRSRQPGGVTTDAGHRPKSHREQGAWPPERMRQWAGTVGPHTGQVVSELLDKSPFPQEQYRSCLGLIRLGRQIGAERMEAACRRALHYGTVSYRSIQTILDSGADREPLPGGASPVAPVEHENVRGREYYEGPPAGAGREG